MPTTTVSIGASGDDGWVYKADNSWPPATSAVVDTAGTETRVDRGLYTGPNYQTGVGLLQFDTSTLPDKAVIVSATLRIYVTNFAVNDSKSLLAEWYAASNWPIDAPDWTDTPSGTAHAGTAISSLTGSADNDLALLDPDTYISRTGYTGLRLHLSAGLPVNPNFVKFASYDHSSLTEARLIIAYRLPGYQMVI